MHSQTLISVLDWIAYLEDSSHLWTNAEARENVLYELIDKAHRRGAMTEETVFALQRYYGLVE